MIKTITELQEMFPGNSIEEIYHNAVAVDVVATYTSVVLNECHAGDGELPGEWRQPVTYTLTLFREDQPKTIVSVEMVVGDKSIIWDTCGTMGLCPECTGKDRGCGKPYAFAECTSTTYYTANLSDGTTCLLTSDEYDHIVGQLANGCHAGKDGDCIWPDCPQLKDGEPAATGRTCPLWKDQTDE